MTELGLFRPASGELGAQQVELADHRRIPRGAVERFLCQLDEVEGVEARSEPFQAQRRHLPVAVAPGAADQIHLLGEAFDEGHAQLLAQGQILARRSGQGRVEITCLMHHPGRVVDDR